MSLFVAYQVKGQRDGNGVEFFENDFFENDMSPYDDHRLESLEEEILRRTIDKNYLSRASVVVLNWKIL